MHDVIEDLLGQMTLQEKVSVLALLTEVPSNAARIEERTHPGERGARHDSGAGHNIHRDCYEETMAAVRAFLSRT